MGRGGLFHRVGWEKGAAKRKYIKLSRGAFQQRGKKSGAQDTGTQLSSPKYSDWGGKRQAVVRKEKNGAAWERSPKAGTTVGNPQGVNRNCSAPNKVRLDYFTLVPKRVRKEGEMGGRVQKPTEMNRSLNIQNWGSGGSKDSKDFPNGKKRKKGVP